MPGPTFTCTVEFTHEFTVEEIWADGDAPENPTVQDVLLKLAGTDDPKKIPANWGFDNEPLISMSYNVPLED
jgi:hypothetical protein